MLTKQVRQFWQLARLFFARFIENDLICVDGDTRAVLAGVVSLLVSPGVFLPLLEYMQFSSYPLGFASWQVRDAAALPDKVLHIAFSMTVLGLITIVEWDALLPDRRDLAVLRPMPIGLGTMFGARLAALLALWTAMTVALDGVSGWFFPVAVVQNAPAGVLLRYIVCHMAAILAANIFIFLALIAVQGWLMTLLGWSRFRRVAPYAQFGLIAGLLTLFFLAIGHAWGVDTDAPPSTLIASLPAWWFVGLDQVRLGQSSPLFSVLAGFVPRAIAAAGLLAAAGYALSYRRCLARAFEEQDAPVGAPGRLRRLVERLCNAVLVRTPEQRAAFYFVLQTIARSRTHRMLVSTWAGVGFALVFEGIAGAIAAREVHWWANLAGPLLPVPIVLPVFLVTGIRYAFTVPSDLHANWVFRTSVITQPSGHLAGARKAALLLMLVPLAVALLPVYIAVWGWVNGCLCVLFGMASAWLLAEVQLAGFEKLPFTCSYVPGKANVRTMWTLYVAGYVWYVAGMSWLCLKVLQYPLLVLPCLAAVSGGVYALRAYRRRRAEFGFSLAFDERPEPAVLTLELRR